MTSFPSVQESVFGVETILPECWPDADRPPLAARAISWWTLPWNVPLSIVRPAHSGARVTRTSAGTVALVHVVALATTVCAMTALLALSRPGLISDVNPQRLPRGERVRTALVLALEDSIRIGDVAGLLGAIAAAPVLVHAAGWLLAWLLAPVIGTGSTPGALFGSAARRVFWSTHFFAWASVAWLAGALYSGVTFPQLVAPEDRPGQYALASLAAVVWWLWLLRLGAWEVADTDQTDPATRRPRCEQCGYGITGLSESGRCPECATPVARSLPHHRDLPAGPPARHTAFLALLRAAFYTPRVFFRRLRVCNQRPNAIRFSLLLALVAAGFMMLSHTAVVARSGQLYGHGLRPIYAPVLWAAATFFLVQGLFVTFAWLGSWLGTRDARRAAIVAAYACVWSLPGIVILAARDWLLDLARTSLDLDPGLLWLMGQALFLGAALCLPIFAWQLHRGLRLTRFANA